MIPNLIYCYDAYCGWCYGFSPVIKQLAEYFKDKIEFEVISGGMIPADMVQPIGKSAGYIKDQYKRVEEISGVEFGWDYLWHINNPDLSDWFPNSEKPAIALCIFKEFYPDRQVEFACDLQYALHFEGRDLTDDEAYRHLLEKYSINEETFYSKLKSDEYKEAAQYEFALCKQLQVTSFPALLLQITETKFHLIAKGYTDIDSVKKRIEIVLSEERN